MRSRVRESVIEKAVVKLVRLEGGRAIKFTSPSYAGVPDRLCFLPGGRIVLVETKAPGGKLTKLQILRITMFQDLGFVVKVVDGIEGLDDLREYVRSSAS